ncbi:hypothetical protein BDN70DRAFT_397809 [Pholiota conissans]|uniref:Uncharacterized protein n=1 Tax=Pholiota conissans TaxID=109636 RepID=A0A9P6CNA4_9AGAR|nr:hypothetical protein BDN70DRAFT_397809 [Pholiota conissans]
MLGRRLCPTPSSTASIKPRKAPAASLSHLAAPSLRPPKSRCPQRPSTTTASPKISARNVSGMALLSQEPQNIPPEPENDHSSPEISDHEWELRTGRAIFVLQETLPEFFDKGLITSINKTTGVPRAPIILPSTNINFLESYTLQDDEDAIYSPNIRLSYTPPLELPAPFPKTFHIEGIQLYLASSSFIRHTMNALYSDLTVGLDKMTIEPPLSSSASRKTREKSISLRQTVNGIARVSGKPAEWEIESTYTFSPVTGLIYQHTINSIRPAPHLAVYDSLRLSLGKLLGFDWRGGPGPAGGAAFKGKTPSPKNG